MTNENKFVHYDEVTEEVLGYFSKEIHGDLIPLPNIEISKDQWQEAVNKGLNAISTLPDNYGHMYSKELRTLEEVKADTIKAFIAKGRNAITSNYVLDALGTNHTYPSNKEDQLNLQTAAASYQDRQIMCMDNATNEWALRTHTQAQAQEVLEFNANRIEQIRANIITKKNQINAATTIEELDSIL